MDSRTANFRERILDFARMGFGLVQRDRFIFNRRHSEANYDNTPEDYTANFKSFFKVLNEARHRRVGNPEPGGLFKLASYIFKIVKDLPFVKRILGDNSTHIERFFSEGSQAQFLLDELQGRNDTSARVQHALSTAGGIVNSIGDRVDSVAPSGSTNTAGNVLSIVGNGLSAVSSGISIYDKVKKGDYADAAISMLGMTLSTANIGRRVGSWFGLKGKLAGLLIGIISGFATSGVLMNTAEHTRVRRARNPLVDQYNADKNELDGWIGDFTDKVTEEREKRECELKDNILERHATLRSVADVANSELRQAPGVFPLIGKMRMPEPLPDIIAESQGSSAVWWNPFTWGGNRYANGGLITRPHFGLVGEAGPEAIIPLSSNRRGRGLALWQQAGEMLGVRQYAPGGVAPSVCSTGTAGVNVEHINIAISVEDSASPAQTVDAIANHLATRLQQCFINMPLAATS